MFHVVVVVAVAIVAIITAISFRDFAIEQSVAISQTILTICFGFMYTYVHSFTHTSTTEFKHP